MLLPSLWPRRETGPAFCLGQLDWHRVEHGVCEADESLEGALQSGWASNAWFSTSAKDAAAQAIRPFVPAAGRSELQAEGEDGEKGLDRHIEQRD